MSKRTRLFLVLVGLTLLPLIILSAQLLPLPTSSVQAQNPTITPVPPPGLTYSYQPVIFSLAATPTAEMPTSTPVPTAQGTIMPTSVLPTDTPESPRELATRSTMR